MLVFFFPFFENLGSYVTNGCVFERHQRSDFFVEKLYGMRARALVVHALARAVRGAARDDGSCSLGHSEAAPQSGQMSCGR